MIILLLLLILVFVAVPPLMKVYRGVKASRVTGVDLFVQEFQALEKKHGKTILATIEQNAHNILVPLVRIVELKQPPHAPLNPIVASAESSGNAVSSLQAAPETPTASGSEAPHA